MDGEIESQRNGWVLRKCIRARCLERENVFREILENVLVRYFREKRRVGERLKERYPRERKVVKRERIEAIYCK